jgi:hypothetical protein
MVSELESPKLVGLIASTFSDKGPIIVYNNTPLDEDEAMVLAIKGMTVIGLDHPLSEHETLQTPRKEEDIKQFGPFPIRDYSNLRALAISFSVKAKETNDKRIETYGRFCVLFLIYPVEYTRMILDSYGLITPYFSIISRNITYDSDLNSSTLSRIFKKMNMLFQGVLPRIFTVTESGLLKELVGKGIKHCDSFLVVNKSKKELQVLLLDPDMSVWRKRKIYRNASILNSNLYRQKMSIVTVSEWEEISKILKQNNLSVEGINFS